MKNVAASVRARLLNHSKVSGESFHAVLEQYITGRFLWRLSQSAYHDRFILKGAQLFRLWSESAHRPTRDLDLLGFGDSSEEAIAAILSEICKASVTPDDGLIWGDIVTTPIRKELHYGGTRATLSATLAGARVSLQIDIGFGDVITPAPENAEWSGLLDFPKARLLAYPPETVIAEKIEAAVVLGIGNSRMKDFFDLHWLSRNYPFQGKLLTEAVQATFRQRGTEWPDKEPIAFSDEFYNATQKKTQWSAFLRKSKLESVELEKVMSQISRFLLPVILNDVEKRAWDPNHGWREL